MFPPHPPLPLGGGRVRERVRRVWAARNRLVDWVNPRLDWMPVRVEGRPTWDMCQACGRPARVLYLAPTPFGVERRCDPCRDAWHREIRDYYARCAAEVAAAAAEALRRKLATKEAA